MSTPTQRRSTYAPIVSGNPSFSRPPRTGAVSHLLNPLSEGTDSHSPYRSRADVHRHYDPHDADMANFYSLGDHPSASAWPQRHADSLPSFSRAFEMYMSRDSLLITDDEKPVASAVGGPPGFLAPSYLRGSVYLQKLGELASQRQGHAAQARAVRSNTAGRGTRGTNGADSKGSRIGPPAAPTTGPGPAAATTTSSTSITGVASHRGMTFDLIEKPPAFEEDEEATVSPLPSRWNKDDKHSALEVLGDGYEVKYTGHRSERDHDAAAIRADHYMPPQCGVYYFEVLILHRKREDTTIAIGFSNSSAALSRAPGWEPGSWGYHGDDGNSFASQNIGKPYGPKFGPGDTIGCLVNFRTGTALFTKNGDELGIAFRDINKDAQGKLFPTIGLKKPGDHILANFGQLPFQFDIDGYMRAEKKSIMDRIDKADTSKLAPPWKEKELIQRLVLQFLQHDGYVETARAFAEEVHAEKAALSNEPGMPLEGINVKDDEDARKRQQIRRAVLEGKIDQALKWVNLYYPQVLADHREVYFRLRCRKFIEMIRKDAEETMRQESGADAEKKDTSAAAPSRTTQQHDVEDEEMEEADGSQQPQQQQQQQQQQQPEWDEQMETEGNDGEAAPPIGKLLQEALLYGQDLRAEFDGWDNPEMSRHLDEIFALIAYKNPLKVKEVAHLLDRSGRVAVAEELNSAILHSLGKSSRAALETLYAQTEVFLDILRRDGGDGAFVTVKDVMDSIPTSQLRS